MKVARDTFKQGAPVMFKILISIQFHKILLPAKIMISAVEERKSGGEYGKVEIQVMGLPF